MHRVPDKKIVSVNFSCAVFSLLVFLTLQAGTNKLTQNVSVELQLYTALYLRLVMQALIWLHVSGSEWSGVTWSGLVLHMQNWNDLTYLNAKFNKITSSCFWVNTVITPSVYLYSDVVAAFNTYKEWQIETWYVFCLKNAFTNNMCVKCEVGLCVPCFPQYNSELALWTIPEQKQQCMWFWWLLQHLCLTYCYFL